MIFNGSISRGVFMCFELSTITEEEKNEIQLFTSQSGYGGLDINRKLRNGGELEPWQSERVNIVNNAIKKSVLTEDVILYRVLGVTNKYKFKRGKDFKDNGFMEASFNKDISEVFPERKYLLIIKVPKGTSCLYDTPYNERTYEQGVLFQKGAILRVDCVKKKLLKNKPHRVFCTFAGYSE